MPAPSSDCVCYTAGVTVPAAHVHVPGRVFCALPACRCVFVRCAALFLGALDGRSALPLNCGSPCCDPRCDTAAQPHRLHTQWLGDVVRLCVYVCKLLAPFHSCARMGMPVSVSTRVILQNSHQTLQHSHTTHKQEHTHARAHASTRAHLLTRTHGSAHAYICTHTTPLHAHTGPCR